MVFVRVIEELSEIICIGKNKNVINTRPINGELSDMIMYFFSSYPKEDICYYGSKTDTHCKAISLFYGCPSKSNRVFSALKDATLDEWNRNRQSKV